MQIAVLFIAGAVAQDPAPAPAPPPPNPPKEVQITFLPPPMHGTISLGIYDRSGKLVRVLHREATEKDFKIGLNGLITRWDGKNDAGEFAPLGKYPVHGWMVGDLKVEGVAFHGNDWLKDDRPRFTEMVRFKTGDAGECHVVLRDTSGQEHDLAISDKKTLPAQSEHGEAVIEDGKLFLRKDGENTTIALADGEKALKAHLGFAGNLWAIVEIPAGREVRSYSAKGEFLRRLAYRPDEPAPFDLSPLADAEVIYLLERNDREQRFRALGQADAPTEASGAWKTIDQKRILRSDTFAGVADQLGRPAAPAPEAIILQKTKPNSLLQNARSEAKLQVSVTADGAILATHDALPLLQLTEAKDLKWAVLVREGKVLTLFQSDGVVVEEFKIGNPDNLMSFDAGEYTLKN